MAVRSGRMGPAIFLILPVLALAYMASCATDKATPPPSEKVDRIIVKKSAHTMTLMHGDEILKSYKVALSRDPIGPKERQGDHKVPEGAYVIDAKNPNSRFHMALHVSYPNAADSERARKLGVNPGGDVEIHGLERGFGWIGSLQRDVDWTNGCIAVTYSEIEEIWPLVPVGTPVEIRP
ncbi:MAG: L,D-transpeptidase family protein [Candidatus Acidiferrales bacterium]